MGFLIRITNGEEIDGRRPCLEHRSDVALKLLNKILPDMKAVEVSGEAGGRLWSVDYTHESAVEMLMEKLEGIARVRVCQASDDTGMSTLGQLERS